VERGTSHIGSQCLDALPMQHMRKHPSFVPRTSLRSPSCTHDCEEEEGGRLRWMADEEVSSDIVLIVFSWTLGDGCDASPSRRFGTPFEGTRRIGTSERPSIGLFSKDGWCIRSLWTQDKELWAWGMSLTQDHPGWRDQFWIPCVSLTGARPPRSPPPRLLHIVPFLNLDQSQLSAGISHVVRRGARRLGGPQS
jgi:hypothetical protein